MNTSQTAISLNNVSKNYKLFDSPVHRVKETFHPFGKKYSSDFRALKNITVEIGWKETIGIVGRNGCGKSTLLQIVCGIMPPTSGGLIVNGRISAILELGAGFNPEFSGRDNIYLNCSILGMEREEVDGQIEDILEFADIGQFVDQPVKTYSSGMAVRLAFSIAINVDPDILVVDEALSVGDAAFQRKCFARIKEIQERGATILFVSHDGGAVVDLCDKAILLDQGEMLYYGTPKKVISLYHKLLFAPQDQLESVRSSIVDTVKRENSSGYTDSDLPADVSLDEITSKAYFNESLVPKSTTWYASHGAEIHCPHIQTLDGRKVNVLVRNEEYYCAYDVHFSENVYTVRFGMLIKTVRGVELGGYGNSVEDENQEYITEGSVAQVRLRFRCSLLPGVYFLNAGVMGVLAREEGFLHRGIDVAMFEVMSEKNIGSTAIVDFGVTPQVTMNLPEQI